MARVVKTETMFEGQKHEQYVVVERDDPPAWPESRDLTYVGKPHTRLDGAERVTGQARYTYDVLLPGMLHAKVLRCPYPHARIKRLDTSRAEALPGVRAVVSHLNTPSIPWYRGRSVIFETELRYAGEEVAAVAADDEYIARDALALIEVEYEELPFITDPEKALPEVADDTTDIGNTRETAPKILERGSLEQGLAEADVVVQTRYTTSTQLHQCMETHGSVAHWEGEQLTLWDSTQWVFGVRDRVAASLGLPLNKVRVLKKYMGGGFGSKISTGKQAVIAALLARKSGRPVKLMLDRREESLATGNRHQTIQHLTLGAKQDGTLTAIGLRSIAGVGAYGSAASVGGPVRELYRCPNVRTEEWGIFTNTGPSASFRAPGYVEGTFALESAMDEFAEKLGMDPIELRARNGVGHDQETGKPYTLKELDRAYEVGAEAVGWKQTDGSQDPTKKRGWGMAAMVWSGGGGPPAHAIVKINSDGSASIVSGTQDIGTGTKTMLAQVAAEELGLPIEAFSVELGDTQDMPYGPLSAGSMTTPSAGPAVRMAAQEAREMLLDLAGSMMDVAREELEISNGEIRERSRPEVCRTVPDILGELDDYMVVGTGSRGPNPDDKELRTFGAQFAEVEVDTLTGKVDVLRVYAVHEVGRVINPLALGSQIEGGVIQGLGFATTEERYVDGPTGKVLNANLEEYKVPTSMDIPLIEHEALDQVDVEANSIGAKGVGEPPIIPTAAAIANAVYDAVGVRIRDLPITPARVLEALEREGQAS